MKLLAKITQLIGGVSFILACSIVHAQWSLGAPGNRLPVNKSEQRYVFMVYANPLPGKEQEFDDWYLNRHLGDLVQLQGWQGAQRFRLVSGITPGAPKTGFDQFGYLVLWDMEGTTTEELRARASAAIAGGKSRRGAGFDYAPGASPNAIYRVLGAWIKRPDGQGPFIPAASDTHTHRPNRYIYMEYSAPSASTQEARLNTALDKRITEVLNLPGWLAAQRFVLEPPLAARAQFSIPSSKFLTIWEVEGESAQAVKDTLVQAEASGKVTALPNLDAAAIQASWWEPISPYITKEDFQR